MSIELGTILADFTTSLSAAMVVGATTGTLQSATDDDGVALPTGRYFFTIDGSNSSKEHISCTLTGTALTAIKSVSRQGVETSGTVRAHRLGASVTLTDFAHLLAINNVLVTGYASATTPTTDYQLATKKYADDISVAGGTNATTTTQGMVELGTQAEIDAGTATGGTGASLVATPATTRGRLINDYAADSVGTDAYAITITPAITAYSVGQRFTFKAGTANTGACTLNVNALGAKTIKKNVSDDLATGDILADQIVEVTYDGTNMQLVSVVSGAKDATKFTGILPLVNGGTGISATQPFSAVTATRNMSTASGSVTYAHGLSGTPTRVKITGMVGVTTGSQAHSIGTFDGTNQNYILLNQGSGSTSYGSNGSSYTVYLVLDSVGNDYQRGSVTVDATNITIAWTKGGTPSAVTAFLLIESYLY